MSHTYGTVRGARGKATRCGNKDGIVTEAASWEGAVRSVVVYDEYLGIDIVRIELTRWRGRGVARELYHGPIGGPDVVPARWSRARLRKWKPITEYNNGLCNLLVEHLGFRIFREPGDVVAVYKRDGKTAWKVIDEYTAKPGEGLDRG